MNEEKNYDVVDDDLEDVVDIDEIESEEETAEKSVFDKAIDWAKDHKVAAIAGAVGTVLGSVFIGAKAFSKTNTVEVEKLPDPTIMDKYDRIPVEEHSYTEYKYVLKDEYNDKV